MNNWYQTKVRGMVTREDGKIETVTEQYMVEAISFTDTEAATIGHVAASGMTDFVVSAITKTKITECIIDKYGIHSEVDAEAKRILHQNESMSGKPDTWYKSQIYFLEVDEKTGKTKKIKQQLLVGAGSVSAAHDVIDDHYKGTMIDYIVGKIDETPIVGVLVIPKKETE